MKRVVVGMVAVAVGTATVIGAAAAREPRAWIAEDRSTSERVTVVAPRHIGAEPLDPTAFGLVVAGEVHAAAVTRPVEDGLDLVVMLDSGRLGDHLYAAKGAAAELLLQLPDSVRVVVWGASAAAPGPDLAPTSPDEAMTTLVALEPAPLGDLGATLRVLADRLGPDRRQAAVVVTPAGEHTQALAQAFDDYDAGLRVVALDPALTPGGPEILTALDALALELPGIYEVSIPAPGAVDAIVVDLGDETVRIPLLEPTRPDGGAGVPPTAALDAPTTGSSGSASTDPRPTTETDATTAPSETALAAADARDMTTTPLVTVELSTSSRSDGPPDLLGRLAIGAAALLSVLLVGRLVTGLIRNLRLVRITPRWPAAPSAPTTPSPTDPLSANGPPTAGVATLAGLYGLGSDGSAAETSRLLCVVELGAASRLDGIAVRETEIAAALTPSAPTRGSGELAQWADALHVALAGRDRRPLADELRTMLARLDVDADVADEAERLAWTTTDPGELHRGLVRAGRLHGTGHRLASLGLALLDPFGTRPAPLAVSAFLAPSAQGVVDFDTGVLRARTWHRTVKRRMFSRYLDRRPDMVPREDPVEMVTDLLDKLVPSPRVHQP